MLWNCLCLYKIKNKNEHKGIFLLSQHICLLCINILKKKGGWGILSPLLNNDFVYIDYLPLIFRFGFSYIKKSK